MKKKVIKIALGALCLMGSAMLAQAQQKFGDNLGNHRAARDLNINGHQILNASGVAIGTAALTNESIALQIDGADKAVLIPRVTNLGAIANAVAGMIVYNAADNKFYVRNDTEWVTYSLALQEATDGINAVGDLRGYTLTQVGEHTVLKLSPATEVFPGIVTTGAQEFGGDKTFKGNVAVDGTNTLTVGTGATTLGGTLSVAGNVAVGTAAVPANTVLNGTLDATGNLTVGTVAEAANTTLNGNLTVGRKTTLAGAVDNGGTIEPGVVIPNTPDAAGLETERYVVVDEDGNMKKSKLSANAFDKRIVAIPAGTSALFVTDNMVAKVILTGITGIKQNDGVVVNFDALTSLDLADYLTITNAAATADETVTVWVADFRQPEETDATNDQYEYTAPDFTSKNFVVTRYQQVD